MRAFAALKGKDAVVTWGYLDRGGHSSSNVEQFNADIQNIDSNGAVLAASKNNGAVVKRGGCSCGDHSALQHQLASDVEFIWCTGTAFAAVKRNDDVLTWVDSCSGADSTLAHVQVASDVQRI